MTKPLPFEDESFDIIFHPVSNCYIENVELVFKECYRILKDDSLIYVWGAVGKNNEHPFLEYLLEVENKIPLRLSDLTNDTAFITESKSNTNLNNALKRFH